ncbi:MAG: hypothetical protein QOH51_1787 [Acidobacteriota bacterium]|nr:hypothetical protein [Acidobacteriota bacterium]
MRSRHPMSVALLLLLSAFLYIVPAARAADDTYDDEYEEHARVLRVSLLKGEVSLKRAGENEWESARLNTPLVEGDLLATGRDSRLEIQVDARNFVRVGGDSVLKVVTLREEGIALSLSEGTATFRLSRFDDKKEYFEVDAPKTTIAAEKTGQYRIDVDRGGGVSVTVREDGRARIYSQTSGFVLRNNRTARLAFDGSEEGDWEVGSAARFDEWDNWNDEREHYLAERLRYEGRERYYDSDVYGAEELDLYGDWVYTRDYGYIWRPHVTVINNYHDWAPYRYGHWAWCPPYGWTWIPDEDWGWAPYHYGRWVYVNNEWCWAPRGYGYRYRRAWWRPALVAFVTIDFGNDRHVCWYPLTYGQRDPRGRLWSRRYDPLTPLRRGEVDNLRRANPALLRAVTSVPARDFGGGALRGRAAAGDLAQRALASEPVRGQLPFTRSDSTRAPRVGGGVDGGRATGANGREVLTINRPAPVMPPRAVPDRPTGAAARTPGVPLDDELRRSRILNNREPRVPLPSTAGGDPQSRDAGNGSTGAVERTRTPGIPTSNSGDNGVGEAPARVRPTRPPVERNGDDGSTREARPTPPLVNRSEPRVRQRDDSERPSMPPARREEPPMSRPEPAEPRESRPTRSEPRQESPRQEAPRQEAPRQEQPRQESPRQEAPRQEAPRQEAPRQEPPRQESPHQESPRQTERTEKPPRPRR